MKELYGSITREVVDEVNIPISVLSQPRFIGVAQNISAGKRPSSEFIIRYFWECKLYELWCYLVLIFISVDINELEISKGCKSFRETSLLIFSQLQLVFSGSERVLSQRKPRGSVRVYQYTISGQRDSPEAGP